MTVQLVLAPAGHGKTAYAIDAIRALTEQAGRTAIEEMTAAGARWVTTDQVVGEQA